MLRKIEIQNFKRLKDIMIDNFSQITLIGGKNNAGKSTLLEAIFFASSNFEDSFLKLNECRRVRATDFSPGNLWEPYFFNYNTDNSIKISWQNDNVKWIMKSSRYNEREQNKAENINLQFIKNRVEALPITVKENYPLKLERSYGQVKSICIMKIVNRNNISVEIHKENVNNGEIKEFNVKYLSPHASYDAVDIISDFGRIDLQGEKNKIIEAMQAVEPHITDITTIVTNNRSQLYATIENGRKIPLYAMGDGINRFLVMIIEILSHSGGIVLIDEIENGLHYTMHEKLWKAIAKAASLGHTQIVATTHSAECLKGAAVGIHAIPGVASDFSYIRLAEESGNIVPKYFSNEDFTFAINDEIEIR